MKLDLLTNTTVVDEAISFVSQLMTMNKEEQEEETGERTSSTHHQIHFTNLAF